MLEGGAQLARDALVVEADAIKYRDVVYQQLNRSLRRSATSSADISKYVHEYSTKAAESLFVTAINQQRVRPRAALLPPAPASNSRQRSARKRGGLASSLSLILKLGSLFVWRRQGIYPKPCI